MERIHPWQVSPTPGRWPLVEESREQLQRMYTREFIDELSGRFSEMLDEFIGYDGEDTGS